MTPNEGDAVGPIPAVSGDVVVLVGTTKGLFALTSAAGREGWTRSGPWFPGEEIAAAVLDTRDGRNRLLAGAMSWHFGPSVYTSDDLGDTWREPEPATLRFPEDTGASVARSGSSCPPLPPGRA